LSSSVRLAIAGLAILAVIAGAAAFVMLSCSARIHPRWEVGHQALYRFVYRGEGVYQPAALFSANGSMRPPQRVYTAVAGTLVETTVAQDATGATVVWNVVDPQVRYIAGSSVDSILAAQLRSDLELPYATRIASDGRIRLVAGSPDASQLGVQFMRTVLGRIQFVAPDSPSLFGRSWMVAEPDTDGSRMSTYTLSRWLSGPFGAATADFARSTNLTVTFPTASPFHRPDILGAGEDRGMWRLGGSVDSLVSTDARNTYYGSTLIARSQSALEIELEASATLDPTKVAASRAYAQQRLASTAATGLHVEPSDADVARSAFTNVLGSDDERSLSERLIDTTRRKANADTATLAQKFAALFYFHPHAVADFAPVLRRARSDSIPFDVLAAAYQQAATPPAQSVLAQVAEVRAREPHAGESLVIGMGFLRHPIPRVDRALEFVSDHGEPDAADSAQLALGSVAGVLAGVDDGRADAIVTRIQARLLTAREDDTRRTELLALGNAHALGSLQAILTFASDPSSDVRAAVATALRDIESPGADDALRALLQDPQADVRVAAASAFERRIPSLQSFAVLMVAMHQDQSADVRAQAVSAVWNARAAFPQAEAAVRAAGNDPDRGVRSAVEFVLAAPAGPEERPVPPDVGTVLGGSKGLSPDAP